MHWVACFTFGSCGTARDNTLTFLAVEKPFVFVHIGIIMLFIILTPNTFSSVELDVGIKIAKGENVCKTRR